MDYNSKLLKLFFKQMNFTKEEIENILENNPFDYNFAIWEMQNKSDNKRFASILKNNHLININQAIQEVVIHEKNSVTNYLENDRLYIECNLSDNLLNSKIKNKNLVIIKDIFPNEKAFIKKLYTNDIPFIIGVCTTNENYYKYALEYYKDILLYLKNLNLLNYSISDQKICILKSK